VHWRFLSPDVTQVARSFMFVTNERSQSGGELDVRERNRSFDRKVWLDRVDVAVAVEVTDHRVEECLMAVLVFDDQVQQEFDAGLLSASREILIVREIMRLGADIGFERSDQTF
jgi:hypothetical protein